MADRIELSVVLPAYREGTSLASLLPKLRTVLNEIVERSETLVVDARESNDDTREVCERFRATHLYREGGNRYGDAVRTGIARANGDYILFMDADGSHDPASLAAMWQRRHDFDIVIGSRYVSGGGSVNGPMLVALSRVLGFVVRLLFRLPVRDVSTSLRLYDSRILKSLRLQANDFDILQEILVRTLIRPGRALVGEVPVTFGSRLAGRSKRRLLPLGFGYANTFVRLKIAARAHSARSPAT